MSGWRDAILAEFPPKVARLTLVSDPDGLLLEEGVLQAIRERGFELIPFEDNVAFRYVYESQFRARWDRGEETDLVVLLRSPAATLDSLPYDLLQAGRRLAFSLGEIFPNLSYPVVAALDRADLDALYQAQTKYLPGRLGDNATKDFILRHVFEIAPELIHHEADLLRMLLSRHYRKRRVPPVLDERLIQVLRLDGRFADWPLERIVSDRESFLLFLQERWPIFLDRLAAAQNDVAREGTPVFAFEIPGPADLPFGHEDIRVYLDTLFLEGALQPVPHERADTLAQTWAAVGIRKSDWADHRLRLERLRTKVEESIPSPEARHTDWLDFAYRWAEFTALAVQQGEHDGEVAGERILDLTQRVDEAFAAWLLLRYPGLMHLPPDPPVMVHHLARYLARRLDYDPRARLALVVVDGLALSQWVVLRESLADSGLSCREEAVFAWIPTITPVSRQAIFAGKPPAYFPATIHTCDREAQLWTQFWVDQGLKAYEVAYRRGIGDEVDDVANLASDPRCRVMGLVVDKVDRIMHGMELGAAGMHSHVRLWGQQGSLGRLLTLLHGAGFRVYLTSDHGNTEAVGCGRPGEGVVADLRGERVRVYPDQLLLARSKEKFPDALAWLPVGLPDGYVPLLASGRTAFVQKGERTVAHGGISLDEVVVPFIELRRRGQ